MLQVGSELKWMKAKMPIENRDPIIVPVSCSGCERRFKSGDHAFISHGDTHYRHIAYCPTCRAEGWPCSQFEEVTVP